MTEFRAQLASQYELLQMPMPACVENFDAARARPELLVFFGGQPWDSSRDLELEQALEAYARDVGRLLPVIEKSSHAETHLSPSLMQHVAFSRAPYLGVWVEALVDEVILLISQHRHRHRRRIFISYRRVDSLAMAQQLQSHYASRGFDAFLDERSLERGSRLSEELRRHLDKSDAVLLLLSPQLSESRWVREELQYATRQHVGVLGIVWPQALEQPQLKATVAQLGEERRFMLPEAPEAGMARMLTEEELIDVDRMIFIQRSRAMSGRLWDLVDYVTNVVLTLEGFTLTARQADGDLELERGREKWVARVLPVRPDLLDLWMWWDEHCKLESPPKGLIFFYPRGEPHDFDARAFGEICGAWCAQASPLVLLHPVDM